MSDSTHIAAGSVMQILRDAGLKPTPGRLAVYGAFAGGACLSAAEVLQQLGGRAHIPPATVYRALATLCGIGLLQRIPSDHGALYVVHAAAPQLICSRCGKVEAVDAPEVHRYNRALMKNRGMQGDGALVMVADCRRKQCNQ